MISVQSEASRVSAVLQYFRHIKYPLLLTAIYTFCMGGYDEFIAFTKWGTLSFWSVAVYYGLQFRRTLERRQRELLQRKSLRSFFSSHARLEDIKILSYNIFLRPPFIRNNRDDLKNERLAEFMKIVSSRNFDIICLQEMFSLGNFRLRRLLSHAYAEGYHFHCRSVSPPLLSGKFIDAGLLILSRFPIVEKDGFVYNHGYQIDAWAAKQVIYAKVQVSEDSYLHVFTTHMQASYYDNAPHLNVINDKMRSNQVVELAEFVAKKMADSAHPCALTGDFNISAKSAHDETIEAHEYTTLMQTLHDTVAKHAPHAHLAVDLLKLDHQGSHPTTYADVCPDEPTKPRETVLTHTADHCTQLAIDYIFWIDTHENHAVQKIRAKPCTTRVEEFFVDGHPFTQLSDHYGVSTVLHLQ